MIQGPATSPRPDMWGTPLLERLGHIMDRGIEQDVFPGGVILVRHRNDILVHEAYGHSFTHEDAHSRSSEPVTTRPETIYDLASVTKLFTATCVMHLVEEGKLQLDDPVVRHLPEFAVNGKTEVTVRHLLSHVGGLPYCRLWEEVTTIEARIQRVMAVTPEAPPGTIFVYHDTNLIVLGKLMEQIDGKSLDLAMKARVLGPLGLDDTGYGPLDGGVTNIAATEDESYVGRGMVVGEVHDENAWALAGIAGHAGLFGTAHDLSIFGQAYLNGGTYEGVRLLAPEAVTEMTRNQIGQLGSRGLGWQLDAPHYMGEIASPQTYGHTGFTGTSIVIDPQRELVVVLLTNRVHPTRNGPTVDPVRRAVADAVLGAVDAM